MLLRSIPAEFRHVLRVERVTEIDTSTSPDTITAGERRMTYVGGTTVSVGDLVVVLVLGRDAVALGKPQDS